MTHKAILDMLGGPHAVQTELAQRGVAVKQVTVRSWALPDRTIPAKYWSAIVDTAKAKDKPLTFAMLAESVKAAA